MIITQTPLRISFFGGGTDFRDYYHSEEGWVLSSAIDKYIFVTIKERFDSKIHIGWTRTERVDHVDELQHELVRECLRKTGVTKGVEIATMGDIPSEGSGLGSSSAVTVGLLNAMYTYLGMPVDQARLAREACEIEIDVLKKPIGVQDQYIAAFGGQRFLNFGRNGAIDVMPLGLDHTQCRRLNQSLMLFYTNVARKAESVLTEQVKNLDTNLTVLRAMKRLALAARDCLNAESFDDFGCLLDEGWQLKKQLASQITNNTIDELYTAARRAGALGGKITGAGAGGFLLLYCRPQEQDRVRQALSMLTELPFNLERDGSKVIFNYRR
jgi:D-glycero-alpha-D-manno-heptose-7-phosphate kinase